jgi:putative intracellular protease/amidase
VKFYKNILSSLILMLPLFLNGSTTADDQGAVLIVVTNHGELGDTGESTGYFLSEVAHPWHVFTEAGYTVEFASPEGGFAPMDPKSFDLEDETNRTFWHTLDAVQGLVHTRPLDALDLSSYVAIFFAGGHGTVWDFPDSESIQKAIVTFFESGRPVGAVCHGPAALVNVQLSDGTHLLKGRKVNGFTDEEEVKVGLAEVVPFLLETRMREAGGEFVESPPFQAHVAVDGNLVTAQNPASATAAAEAVVDLLDKTE